MTNFAITGVSGVVAPRHLQAITSVGGRIIAALDPHDAAGVLDGYDTTTTFFTDTDRFDRHLEKLRRGPEAGRMHWLSVCSPNYLHDAHCRLGLRLKADVICEKPVVINPWNLDALRDLEEETGHRVFTVLQLRAHDRLVALREELSTSTCHDVELTYVTTRGAWYDVSWKGSPEKSGGILTNIGVHMFDLLLWLFGAPIRTGVHLSEPRRIAGYLELERARVRWLLSVNASDVPPGRHGTFRSIRVDGTEIEFSNGFADLHTRVYERTLAGNGFGLQDARGSIELCHRLRSAQVEPAKELIHPLLQR